MLNPVTVACRHCQHPVEVIPRITVSFFGGNIPTFDPPLCPECCHILHPTPTEWSTILRNLESAAETVPSQWWNTYALCNGPCPPISTTA